MLLSFAMVQVDTNRASAYGACCRDLAIMISPTEPERCRNEGRNAPEWWSRCEEQGRRLREQSLFLPWLSPAMPSTPLHTGSESALLSGGLVEQCRRWRTAGRPAAPPVPAQGCQAPSFIHQQPGVAVQGCPGSNWASTKPLASYPLRSMRLVSCETGKSPSQLHCGTDRPHGTQALCAPDEVIHDMMGCRTLLQAAVRSSW